MANFLTDQRNEKNLEYSTLNVYRSSLSAYHPEIEGYKVGQHPIIKQVLQGMFNAKPPRPRYTNTWDVNRVLQYIKALGANDKLALRELTYKLVMLMALVSASRGSELHKINPTFMSDKGTEVTFHIVAFTKMKRPSKPHISVTFREYEEDSLLDVIACLRQYLTSTIQYRLTSKQKEHLFLSYRAPHNPVVPSSIARWLKLVMEAAGVDITTFKAHSTRSASTSKASSLGLSTNEIIERANWSNTTTFSRFYHKDIQKPDEFQMKVLAC